MVNVAGVTCDLTRQGVLRSISERCKSKGVPYSSIKVSLKQDKTNEYDKNAVAVYLDCDDSNKMIGFVPKDIAVDLTKLMDLRPVDSELFIIGSFDDGEGNNIYYCKIILKFGGSVSYE